MLSFFLFIGILVVLILAHEFGHFIVAKAFGIRVDEFGIFFPPRLFGKKFGETTYTINALPFGGFVKIFGENADETTTEIEKSRSFVHKPRLVQAAVIVAGIIFNIIFAWIIVSVGYMIGMQTSKDHIGVGTVGQVHTTVVQVLPNSPAEKAGIKPNDIVEKVQTATEALQENSTATEVQQYITAHGEQSMVIMVKRDNKPLTFVAKPAEGIVPGHKALGIQLDDVGILRLNPLLAFVQGAIVTKEMTIATAVGLGSFFYTIAHGTANFGAVAGPIGIVKIGASAVSQGIANTIILTALISINLAIINIIPIPGLDGGRLLFIVIEAITRKPISEKFASRFTMAGLALLITLMLVISYHDVLKLLG